MGEKRFIPIFSKKYNPNEGKIAQFRMKSSVKFAIVNIKMCLKYEKWERVQGIMKFMWSYNWDGVWWMTDFWFDVAFTTVAVCLPLGAGGTEWIKSSEVDKN